MTKYKKHVLKTQFFRSYRNLSTVIDKMNADLGGINQAGLKGTSWCTPYLGNELPKYLKIKEKLNICAVNHSKNDYMNYTNTTKYNSGDCSLSYGGIFILEDGSYLFNSTTCDTRPLIILQIDINGLNKGPNRAGYDLFAFYVNKNNKLVPFSETTNNNDFSPDANTMHYYFGGRTCNNSSGSNNGMGCAMHALLESDYFDKLKF